MNQNSNVINWPFFQDREFSSQNPSEFHNLRSKRSWFLWEGIALVALGLIAMSASVFTTIVSMGFLGWLLLIGGIIHSVRAFSTPKWSGFMVTLLAGILYAVAGVLIIRSPMATAIMLTFLIAPLLMVGGIVRALAAATIRFPQWGWSTFSGVMGLVLGVLIWNQWPTSGLWLIGTLIGIEMFFSGVSMMALSMALKVPSSIRTMDGKVAA
jgi:uncharacterized membrane protein HdeD (DUF308 family)